MIVLRLIAIASLGAFACIEPGRPLFPAELPDTLEVIDEVGEVAGDTMPEVDTQPQCRNDDECPIPAESCRRPVCDRGVCGSVDKDDGAACDDGNACTNDGVCRANKCVDASLVQDGAPCDDGLICNGIATCSDGLCSIPAPPSCEPSGAVCVGGAICSEDVQGGCMDTPEPYGTPCAGPLVEGVSAKWICSELRCVPPEMVTVPSATFVMGCPIGYCVGATPDNGPAHEVRLSTYAIDRVETSVNIYRSCIEDEQNTGVTCAPRFNEGDDSVVTEAKDSPVRWIDWDRAQAVCAYQGKRLCTEAEWEHAARGDGTDFFPWGIGPPTCDRATFFSGGPGCGIGEPSLVDSKPLGASKYGALNMAGNVAEWVVDYYNPVIYEGRKNRVELDPVQSMSIGAENHVVRGGSFRDGLTSLWLFLRTAEPSDVARDDLGVRCCLSLDAP